MDRIEELLEMPYWVIDILPFQVPADSAGQYFAVEKYYYTGPRRPEIKKKHADILLKLNCYRGLVLAEEGEKNPAPEALVEAVLTRRVILFTGEAMIVSEPDDTCLTVYGPDEALLELLRMLAAGEGMYLWQP